MKENYLVLAKAKGLKYDSVFVFFNNALKKPFEKETYELKYIHWVFKILKLNSSVYNVICLEKFILLGQEALFLQLPPPVYLHYIPRPLISQKVAHIRSCDHCYSYFKN